MEEELIFGKNAVLAYLERADDDVPGEYQKIQRALAQDAAALLSKSKDKGSGEPADELVQEIEEALVRLRRQTGDKGLRLPSLSQIQEASSIKITKILLAADGQHDGRVEKIKSLAKRQRIPLHSCDKRKLDQVAGPSRRHQGVVAMISQAEMWTLDTFLQKLVLDRISYDVAGKSMDGYMIAMCDGIEDPHNLGAIIRVAEAAGVKALLLPQRRSVGLTGTVAKISAGALASLPVVSVSNLVHALETLKKYGFWVAALDLDGKEMYTQADLKRPLVVVIGSEGQGVGRLVKEHCDMLLKIPMLGRTESLNASVASGIFFYEVVRQCGQK